MSNGTVVAVSDKGKTVYVNRMSYRPQEEIDNVGMIIIDNTYYISISDLGYLTVETVGKWPKTSMNPYCKPENSQILYVTTVDSDE